MKIYWSGVCINFFPIFNFAKLSIKIENHIDPQEFDVESVRKNSLRMSQASLDTTVSTAMTNYSENPETNTIGGFTIEIETKTSKLITYTAGYPILKC